MTRNQIYRAVRTALKQGVLSRPSLCQRCGRKDDRSSGRSIIHAHHSDYSQPLKVEWLCAKCHRAETPLPAPRPIRPETSGHRNSNAKFTREQALSIRDSDLSCRRLARLYGVGRKTISFIKRGLTYADIENRP